MASVVFVHVTVPRTKFLLESKFLKDILRVRKGFFACFIDLKEAYDRINQGNLWKVLQQYN